MAGGCRCGCGCTRKKEQSKVQTDVQQAFGRVWSTASRREVRTRPRPPSPVARRHGQADFQASKRRRYHTLPISICRYLSAFELWLWWPWWLPGAPCKMRVWIGVDVDVDFISLLNLHSLTPSPWFSLSASSPPRRQLCHLCRTRPGDCSSTTTTTDTTATSSTSTNPPAHDCLRLLSPSPPGHPSSSSRHLRRGPGSHGGQGIPRLG